MQQLYWFSLNLAYQIAIETIINVKVLTKQGYAFQMVNKYHFEPQWK